MTNEQQSRLTKRRLRQPTKDVLREQLALAADEIMRLREENETRPWIRYQHAYVDVDLWFNSFEDFCKWRALPWWRRLFA